MFAHALSPHFLEVPGRGLARVADPLSGTGAPNLCWRSGCRSSARGLDLALGVWASPGGWYVDICWGGAYAQRSGPLSLRGWTSLLGELDLCSRPEGPASPPTCLRETQQWAGFVEEPPQTAQAPGCQRVQGHTAHPSGSRPGQRGAGTHGKWGASEMPIPLPSHCGP